MTQFSTVRDLPLLNTIPLKPMPRPSMVKPRRLMTSVAAALIVMAVPAVSILTPPMPGLLTMLIDLLIVTEPYPAGLSVRISPPALVMLNAA